MLKISPEVTCIYTENPSSFGGIFFPRSFPRGAGFPGDSRSLLLFNILSEVLLLFLWAVSWAANTGCWVYFHLFFSANCPMCWSQFKAPHLENYICSHPKHVDICINVNTCNAASSPSILFVWLFSGGVDVKAFSDELLIRRWFIKLLHLPSLLSG